MRTIAVIMTGGHSSRMGRDKATLALGRSTLLSYMIHRWEHVFDGAAVSVEQPGRYGPLTVPELPDLRRDAGPMAGLEAALSLGGADAVFLSAVDLPFGSPALARRLVQLREGADICFIRRQDGRPEPLFAVYSASCLPVVTRSLDAGERALFRGLFRQVRVREVREDELPEFDLEHILFNVNSPEQWQKALSYFDPV